MVHTSLIYDEVVETVARSVEGRADDVLVQDTSWPGYEDIPRWIVEGYSTLFTEIDDQIGGTADLVAVPTGVGSLLQAALQHYRAPARADPPAVLAVEPATAACVTASLSARRRRSRRHLVPHDDGRAELRHRLRDRLARDLGRARRRRRGERRPGAVRPDSDLHAAGLPVGPCGAARARRPPGGRRRPELTETLGLDARSVVVLISTEGIAANPVPADSDAAGHRRDPTTTSTAATTVLTQRD